MRALLFSILFATIGSFCFAQGEPLRDGEDHKGHNHLTDTVAVVVDTVRITLDGEQVKVINSAKYTIEGVISPYNFDKKYTAEAIDRLTGRVTKLKIEYDGRFFGRMTLEQGVNYIDVKLREKIKNEAIDVDSTTQILFQQAPSTAQKEAIIWIDQFSIAKLLTADTMAIDLVRKVKGAGFTAIALEAKNAEGFASYRDNDLSGTPYLSATKNVRFKAPSEVVDSLAFEQLSVADSLTAIDSLSTPDSTTIATVEPFDLLGSIAGAADTLGVKFYALFNFFTEGNITTRDTEPIETHPQWESYAVQASDSTLNIVPITQSTRGQEAYIKGNRLQYAFTNPAHPEVQKMELARVREVIKNYPIDGVIIGRCRYDGLDTDFSDLSRAKFEVFLTTRGKLLKNFPADILSIDKGGKVTENEYFDDWIEFRASVISDFTRQLKDVVDSFNTTSRKVELAAYVGNWYDKYYGYGVNWASENFRYNEMLDFDRPTTYTEAYATTSFLRSLDFLVVGSFRESLKRDVALATLLTEGELPLVVALKMPDQMTAILMLHAVEASSRGVAMLDLSQIGDLNQISPLLIQAMPEEKATAKVIDKSAKKAVKEKKIK